jgi:hypothetical protein
MEPMSPHSTLSFSLSSPPRLTGQTAKCAMSPCQEGIHDLLAATISPSIFSPDEKPHSKHSKDPILLSSSGFPLFADLHSPAPVMYDSALDDSQPSSIRGAGLSGSRIIRKGLKKGPVVSKILNNIEKVPVLANDPKSTPVNNNLDVEMDALLSGSQEPLKKEKCGSATRQISLKSKKLNKNLVVTPESTLVPPLLSPDQESSRKLTMETPAFSDNSFSNDSDTGSALSSSKKDNKKGSSSPGSRTTCNCKKSKCLKLYCDCFAVLNYCDPNSCNCSQCHNVMDHEDTRTEAIRITKERNSLAFKTKISQQEQHHVTGCHCKNSHCLKKYCECFNGGALCGTNCKCQQCQNFSGSMELAKTRENSPKIDGSITKKRKESPNSISWLSHNSPDVMNTNQSAKILSTATTVVKEEKKSHYSLRGNQKPQESSAEVKVESKRDPAKVHQSKKRKVTFVEPALTYPFFGPHLPEAPKRVALLVLDCLNGKEIYAMSQVNGIWCDAARDDALWE